jgi:hypothetical protein
VMTIVLPCITAFPSLDGRRRRRWIRSKQTAKH